MRRKDREITDFSKMLEIVKACDCCRIGLVDGDEAYMVPMNFGYEEENGKLILYFHSAREGRKIDLISKGPKVTFQMDTGHELVRGENACQYSYSYQSVMGRGYVKILKDPEEKVKGLKRIMAHYTNEENWTFHEKPVEAAAVLQMEVREWTCKVYQSAGDAVQQSR